MKKIALIDASPRIGEVSASFQYLSMLQKTMDGAKVNAEILQTRKITHRSGLDANLERLFEMDAIVFAFPLYNFGLPGVLMDLLEKMHARIKENGRALHKIKVYCIVNCGFPEPYINAQAVKTVELFCKSAGMDFRFGILLGNGPVLYRLVRLPVFKKAARQLNDAYAALLADIQTEGAPKPADRNVALNMPRKLYYAVANSNWNSEVKHNHLGKRDIYRRPFAVEP